MRFSLGLTKNAKVKTVGRVLTLILGGLLASTVEAQTGVGMPSIAATVRTTMSMSGHSLPARAPGSSSVVAPMPIAQPMASAPAGGSAMEQYSLNSMRASGDNIAQQMAATAANQQAQMAGNIGINAGYAAQMNQLSINAAFTQSALANQFQMASLQEVMSSGQAQSTARAAGIRAGVAAGGTAFSNGTGFVPGVGLAGWSPFGGMGLGAGGGMSAFGGSYQSMSYGPLGGMPTFANFGGKIGVMSGLPGYGFSPGYGSSFAAGVASADPISNISSGASNPWGRPETTRLPALCMGTASECGAQRLADRRADGEFAQFRYFMEGPANNIQFANGQFGLKYGNIRIQAPGTLDQGSLEAMNGYNHASAAVNNMFSNRMLPQNTTVNMMPPGSNLYNAPGIGGGAPADWQRTNGLFQPATNTIALSQTGPDRTIYHELGHAVEHQIVERNPVLAAQAGIAASTNQLNSAYNHGHERSYAQTNSHEGFAENTVAYFNQSAGQDTYYRGGVVTNQDLQAQNPAAHGLMRQVFGK